MACDLLDGNIGSCTDKTAKGFTQRAIIGNRTEIATAPYVVAEAICSDLTLVSPKKCFEVNVSSKKPYEEFKTSGEDKKFGMLFKNDITLWIKGLNPTTAKNVNKLTGGEFFVILEQKGAIAEERFVVIGIQAGLLASAAEWNAAEGAWSVVLTEEMCDGAALFLYKTSPAITLSLVNGLVG